MLNREEKTKIRWLLEAWWRYLQARWGYMMSAECCVGAELRVCPKNERNS